MANETLNTAMGSISGIVAFLGFCGAVWKYLKSKFEFEEKLAEFNRCKERLQRLRETTDTRMRIQLQGPGKVVREDVQNWLDAAGVEISEEQSVEYLVKQKGILSLFYRTGIVKTRTAALKIKYETGEILIGEGNQLVDDDASLERFTEQKDKLKVELRDVEERLRTQLVPGKIETEKVKLWRGKVEEITGQTATDIETKFSNVPQEPEFPNLVKQKIREMELLCQGAPLPESLVISDPSASEPFMLTPELQGNHDVKEEILRHLMGDETAKIGVWGMPGVGKTTIMMHVYNQLLEEHNFKEVIWVTVSEKFDARKIQDEIARNLKAEKSLSKHQESRLRATALSQILEMHKPYVLILDDVWNNIDLEEVGIPQPRVNDPCKLLLTTRSKEVARGMGCVTIEVKTLSPEASLNLFNDIVGDVALSEDGDIKKTLKLIVDECDGLPLAIKVVASGMKGIFEPHRWRAALSQLTQGKRKDVYRKLKFSYDWLNDKNIQHCFLHCALYPEDHKIPKEELIEYWIAEELIDVTQTRREMKDEGHAILSKLEENCLLEFTLDIWAERDCVRMHDLVRDMAIDITRSSSPRFLVKAGMGLRELPEEHEWKEDLSKVSLMSNNIKYIPSSMPSPKCPILTTLLLSRNKFSTIPKLFFEHMPELKVLDLSDNRKLRSLPSSVSNLVRLTTLLLRGCWSLKEVPSLSNLTALKKLDLYEAGLEEVPHGVEMLLNLKYLDIRRLSGVPNMLLYLNIRRLSGLQVEGGQLGGIWPKLENFYGGFRTWSDMCIFLSKRQKNLYHYNIYVGDPNNIGYANLLNYIRFDDINIRGEPGSIPSDVQDLLIRRCNDVRSLNAISGFQDVFDLQRCEIRDCTELEYAFSSLEEISIYKLSKLKRLKLSGLENLKGLFDSEAAPPPLAVFSSLEEISIYKCPKLKKLFPTTLQCLPNLKAISIDSCSQLEEIMVASSDEEEEEGRVIHAKLVKLSLEDLPMLRSIPGLTVASVFDSLKELSISGCRNLDMEYVFQGQFIFNSLKTLEKLKLEGLHNLKSVFHEEADESLTPQSGTETISFPLKELEVQNCPQLKNIFPNAVQLDSFKNLESIEVKRCDELEIMAAVSSETEEDQSEPILPKLERLSLIELPVLRRICFDLLVPDSLRKLTIEDCPNLSRESLFGLHVELPRTLYSLSLKGVRNLESVFDEEASDSLAFWRLPPAPTTSFALGTITVANCPQLKNIFTHAGLLGYFQKLKSIRVTGCDELDEIMAASSETEEDQSKPFLSELILIKLPVLRRICSALLVPDSLEVLTIEDCPNLSWESLFGLHAELPQKLYSLSLKGVRNLESVFGEEASDSLAFWRLPPAATSTFAIRRISVANCPQLKKIFAHAGLLDYFQNMQKFVVRGCDELEEIISSKPEEEPQKLTRLPKLEEFNLCNLPKLKKVSNGTSGWVCKSLKKLTISGCTELRRFPLHLPNSGNGQLSRPPRLREIELSDKEKEWWESMEWDQPNAKDVLRPLCIFRGE